MSPCAYRFYLLSPRVTTKKIKSISTRSHPQICLNKEQEHRSVVTSYIGIKEDIH